MKTYKYQNKIMAIVSQRDIKATELSKLFDMSVSGSSLYLQCRRGMPVDNFVKLFNYLNLDITFFRDIEIKK